MLVLREFGGMTEGNLGRNVHLDSGTLAPLLKKLEQGTTILLTHKHSDHSGELKSFPNAKIYVGEEEMSSDELQGISNLVPVKFTNGAYYNFPESQKIWDGITFIKAKDHTNGNSIVIIEKDDLFYMIHGDITNLEANRVMDLENPVPTVLAEVDLSHKEASG